MQSLIIFFAQYLIFLMYVGALIYYFFQPLIIRKQILIFSVLTIPLSYLLAKIAGLVYNNPRPFVIDGSTPMFAHLPNNGFPSDHTLFSAVLGVILYKFNKKLGLIYFFLAIIIGIARVLANVHHIIDVMAGLLIVVVVGFLVNKYIFNKHKE